MSNMLATIRSYIPHSLLEWLLSGTNLSNEPLQKNFQAAVLFADVSGFTSLTEALAQKGDEGPEEITQLLNRYFGRMIQLLEAEGGDVVKFSGDALTVVFPVRDESMGYAIRRAKQAADSMQVMMTALGPVQSSVGPVELALKVGIGSGNVKALLVGGVFRRWEYVLAGEALLRAATAEGTAQRGDVKLDPESQKLIVADPLLPRSAPLWDLESLEEQSECIERLKRFLPGAVRSWMVHEEFHDWLGVLRTMSVLFIGLQGIEYAEEQACTQLHRFLLNAQKTVYRYQGSINKLVVDDKGTIFLVLFGAPPFAHADDPLRAVRCALDLLEGAREQALSLRVGVTTGRVFAGPVGSHVRREYTAMGDAVNLAARLMGQVEKSGVLCDEQTYQLTHNHIQYKTLSAVQLKGKEHPVALFCPLSVMSHSDISTEGEAMIGRRTELAQLILHTDKIKTGSNQVILLEAEAGLGKTMLLHALEKQVHNGMFQWLSGAGQSLEQLSGFWAWRPIFNQLLGLKDEQTIYEREQCVVQYFESLSQEYQDRMSLLNDVLGLELEESPLVASLDAATRQQSLTDVLLFLLTQQARQKPLCIMLENLQWLDSLSWDFVLQLARFMETEHSGILFLLSSRPLGEQALVSKQMKTLRSFAHTTVFSLCALSAEETLALVAARLEISPLHVPKELKDIIVQRSGGNPLFVREIIALFLQEHILEFYEVEGAKVCRMKKQDARSSTWLPDSLEGLLLARLDQLSPTHQLILKVASVIGQHFPFEPLHHTLRAHSKSIKDMLREHLDELSAQGFVQPEQDLETGRYVFNHLATKDVAYRTLLYQQRRQLHRSLAEWFELKYSAPAKDTETQKQDASSETLYPEFPTLPDTLLSTVAHHWRNAGLQEKERHYTLLAGEFSMRQFANQEAVQHFTRVLELTPGADFKKRYPLLLRREQLFDILGDRDKQKEDIEALECCLEHIEPFEGLEISLRRLNYTLATAQFEDAALHAQTELGRTTWDAENVRYQALFLQAYGRSLVSLGRLDDARVELRKALESARQSEEHGIEASILRIIGNTYAMRSAFDQALPLFQEALDVHNQLDEHANAIKALNNIGLIYRLIYRSGEQLERSIEVFKDALRRANSIGSKTLESLVIGNLASAFIELGRFNEAQTMLERGVRLSRQIGSPNDECTSIVFLGEVAMRMGLYAQANAYFTDAIQKSQAIGHRYMEGYGKVYLAEAMTLAQTAELHDVEEKILEALHIANQMGDPTVIAGSQLLLGHLHWMKQESQQAQESYLQAQEGYEKLSFVSKSMEAQAGTVRVALLQGDSKGALKHAQSIVAYLASEGFQGIREPFWVMLTCVEAYRAEEHTDADRLLQTYVGYIEEQTKTLPRSAVQAFLNKVGVKGLRAIHHM